MKKYLKPESEVIELLQEQLLTGSGGDFDDNKMGAGGSASEGGNPISGGGTRSPEFFGDGSVEEE